MLEKQQKEIKEKYKLPYFEEKALYFKANSSLKARKKWILANSETLKIKLHCRKMIRRLKKPQHLPKWINFFRWILIDFYSGKQRRFWGIYQFVALPGQGKTLSMVAHCERARKQYPDIVIGANFGYKYATHTIEHWEDIIKISSYARKIKKPCIIMMDEIHVTFDSSDWHSFPAELLALLSFNRKFELEFLCTSQIYERIPKKIRDIANYTVICKNVLSRDRYFKNYYYAKDEYESTFDGKKANAKFIREFIADDDFYCLYDTLEQVDQMKLSAKEEKDKRAEAFDILFGKNDDSEAAASTLVEASASA